jgi:hypothetical protein
VGGFVVVVVTGGAVEVVEVTGGADVVVGVVVVVLEVVEELQLISSRLQMRTRETSITRTDLFTVSSLLFYYFVRRIYILANKLNISHPLLTCQRK